MTHSWYSLADHFCARRSSRGHVENTYFERCVIRRYNYAHTADTKSIRLIFLREAGNDPNNKTLIRNGRFIWCKNLSYEGLNSAGLREVSFTIGKGKKRFTIAENLVLCLPSNTYVNNNSFLRDYDKIFPSFSSVFYYEKAQRLMAKSSPLTSLEVLARRIEEDCPYRPGVLVKPRMGYFMPNREKLSDQMDTLASEFCAQHFCRDKFPDLKNALAAPNAARIATQAITPLLDRFFLWYNTLSTSEHPYGIILGKSRETSGYTGRELYRVNFGGTIYEQVHPIQMEITNEI